MNELQSLVDYGRGPFASAISPPFDSGSAPGCDGACGCTAPGFTWSSTRHALGGTLPYFFGIWFDGAAIQQPSFDGYPGVVRAVRGGA